MKLFSRENRLSNNIHKNLEGKLVIHKYTNAIFQVVSTTLVDNDLRIKVALVYNPCNYTLVATGNVSFRFSVEKNKGFWIEKHSTVKVFNYGENIDICYNVVVEDLYLIN